MGTESERQDVKKAMAYDLIQIIDAAPQQQSYTPEEVKKIITTYITTTAEK